MAALLDTTLLQGRTERGIRRSSHARSGRIMLELGSASPPAGQRKRNSLFMGKVAIFGFEKGLHAADKIKDTS